MRLILLFYVLIGLLKPNTQHLSSIIDYVSRNAPKNRITSIRASPSGKQIKEHEMDKHARHLQSQEANQPASKPASQPANTLSIGVSFEVRRAFWVQLQNGTLLPATLIYHLIILKSAQQVIENFKLTRSYTRPIEPGQVGFVFLNMDFPFEWFPFFGFSPFAKKRTSGSQLTGGQRFVTLRCATVPRLVSAIMRCHRPFPFFFCYCYQIHQTMSLAFHFTYRMVWYERALNWTLTLVQFADFTAGTSAWMKE